MSPRCRTAFMLACIVTLAACSDDVDPTDAALTARTSVIAPLAEAGSQAIAGRYIVVFRSTTPNAPGLANQLVNAHGGSVHHTYEHAIRGFAATLPPQAVDAIRRNPNVEFIEEDALVQPTTDQLGPPSWGLDRIDARSGFNGIYSYNATGAGVRAYIIDSGIRITHNDFGGRASVGIDLVDPADGMAGQDCNGHGTHVAGTVAGTLFGVAKGAQVVSVRVFPCAGGAPFSRIIAAVDWVTANAVKPAVVNMSLGGGFSAAVNTALQNSINSGIPYVVAAGNENTDACLNSPASAPNALTVGSTASNDTRSTFSNWGNCLDIFAPGTGIVSSWFTGDAATATLNGTSMAAPHVAGVAALFLQGNTTATPAQVNNAIKGSASLNRVRTYDYGAPDLGPGSPNVFLFSPLTPYERVASLNPSDLVLTFVRTSGGDMGMTATDDVQLNFQATGTGFPHATPVMAGGGVDITSTSASISTPIQLRNVGTRNLEWSIVPFVSWLDASPADGFLTPGSTTLFTTTINSTGVGTGTYFSQLPVNDEASPDLDEVVNVAMRVVDAVPITAGSTLTGLTQTSGGRLYFELSVPAVPEMIVSISGGTGDADLYVRYGDAPDFHRFHCRPFLAGNNEICAVSYPPPGTYFIMLHAWTTFGGVTLTTLAGGPPTAPGNVLGTPFSSNRIDVSWNDNSSNELGFVIQRTTMVDGSPTSWIGLESLGANATAFSDLTVTPGTTYRYRVRGCNVNGCSAWARSANVTAPPLVTLPNAPTALNGTPVSTSQIDLTWTDQSNDEDEFRLERRARVDGSYTEWVQIAVLAPNTAAYSSSGLAENTPYQYRIRACNAAGCSVYASTASIKTLATVPLAPGNALTVAVSGSRLRTTWTDESANEQNFVLQRRTRPAGGSFGPYEQIAKPAANTTGYNDNGLIGGDTHQYRVRACNATGCSAFVTATAVTVPTIPAAPTNLLTAVVSSTALTPSWTDNSGDEAGFELQRRIRGLDNVFSDWELIVTTDPNVLSFNDTGLLPGRVYQYRVRSCNPAGCSTYSLGAQTTTPN